MQVIRYSHYALSCIGSPPYLITYLRYTAFILLYPVGVGPGEIWLMYQALPFIKTRNLYADTLPFSYYNFVKVRFEILKERVISAGTLIREQFLMTIDNFGFCHHNDDLLQLYFCINSLHFFRRISGLILYIALFLRSDKALILSKTLKYRNATCIVL
uniref:Very-long-chain (3R)-3-hydroxyacyl-CoA dehydratase n=1 Tax=Solanum tuberosum TaxID=4113 RepID=M1B9E8_SOLTU